MKLEFKRMSEIDYSEHVALNTNPLVMRQMPLSDSDFEEEVCKGWIAGKERIWRSTAIGPGRS
jgi:[ribosomal protein S5]-alanine N-acetyltransferase